MSLSERHERFARAAEALRALFSSLSPPVHRPADCGRRARNLNDAYWLLCDSDAEKIDTETPRTTVRDV